MYQENSLQMRWCLDCHRNPAKYIRPKDQVFNMAYQRPADDPDLGERLVREYKIAAPSTSPAARSATDKPFYGFFRYSFASGRIRRPPVLAKPRRVGGHSAVP